MKKLIIAVISTLVATSAFAQMSIEDRVGELEAAQSLNIFEFGGLLQTRYDNIEIDPGTAGAQKTLLNYHRLRASININANVSPKIRFYSRYTTTKVFNEYYTQGSGSLSIPKNLDDGRDYTGGSSVFLEKAYADINISDSVIFSVGRLPTVDGPILHWNTGRAREGTYPMMIYNAELDGYALSYNSKLDGGDSISARLIYTPLTYWYTGNGLNGGFTTQPTFDNKKTNTLNDLTSVMFEYNSNPTWADNFSVIYQGYQTGTNGFNGSNVSCLGTGNAGVTAACGANGTGNMFEGAVYFKILAHNITASAENIGDSGLDFGISTSSTDIINDEGFYLTAAGGAGTRIVKGVAAEKDNETVRGTSTLFATRYNMGATAVGLEYVNGGKGTFVYQGPNDDFTGFHGTPGTATNLYVTHKLQSELALKLGYMSQDYKYSTITFGPITESQKKIKTLYANLRLDF